MGSPIIIDREKSNKVEGKYMEYKNLKVMWR